MSLIYWNVEFKLKWKKYCVLSTNGNDNHYANSDNTIFTIKDTKLSVSVVTLLVKYNRSLLKASKRFERSVYWKEYKTKNENKITINDYRYFLESSITKF